MATEGNFELVLLNQLCNGGHYSGTLTYDVNVPIKSWSKVTQGNRSIAPDGWGYSQFISNEDRERITLTCQYLKNDCLFFQVTKL